MGKVWRAHHAALKRDDALKVLPDAFDRRRPHTCSSSCHRPSRSRRTQNIRSSRYLLMEHGWPHLLQLAEGQSEPGLSRQQVGVRQVTDRIWLVSFMEYDLGYFDDETCKLESIDNPFGPKVLPMSPEWTGT